jgi:lipopolysaccharide transport system ATP-binding protein
MSSSAAIEVESLSKCFQIYEKPSHRLLQMLTRGKKQFFREFWAIKDLSMSVQKGETFGIIGRNGGGKSTLLQLICGTLNATSGSIKTQGRVAALLELGSGFNPEFTGRDNVILNAGILGLTPEEIDNRFDAIVAFADIGDFIDQPVKTYSSGMMVRLAFSVIAHVDADILVIDEALAVGDAFFTQKCMRFLREFMEKGTLLFVSHDISAVVSLCTRAVWLERGQIMALGEAKAVCEQYLEAFYEDQQGSGTTTKLKTLEQRKDLAQVRDQRLDFINASALRNDLEIFSFDSNAPSFGRGGAQISSVALLDQAESPLAWAVGGETVIIRIVAQTTDLLERPIIGFFVKDRLGQTLFGDNTYLSYQEKPVRVDGGSKIVAKFSFNMPILPPGEYSIQVAIADGTQETHVQHHWIHDAVVFRSMASSVVNGLIGIPMASIELFEERV